MPLSFPALEILHKWWGGPPYSCFRREFRLRRFPQPSRRPTVENSLRTDYSLSLLLLPTHRLRYVREERATRCYDFDPPYPPTSRPESRAAGCDLFPKRILRCRRGSDNPTLL